MTCFCVGDCVAVINKTFFFFFCVGDRVGVMRTANGSLHFFVNGVDQGPADKQVPNRLFAVIDMYGKCAQVTVIGDSNRDKGKNVF